MLYDHHLERPAPGARARLASQSARLTSTAVVRAAARRRGVNYVPVVDSLNTVRCRRRVGRSSLDWMPYRSFTGPFGRRPERAFDGQSARSSA